MDAVSHGDIEITQLLLSAGANVDASNNDGETALMLAVINRRNEIIAQLLISAGADCNGISPIDVFILKHPNLFKAATISAVAGVGYKIWQNFNK